MKLTKLRETIQRKLRGVEDHKSEIEQDKETLKSTIIGLERGNVHRVYPLINCFWAFDKYFKNKFIFLVLYDNELLILTELEVMKKNAEIDRKKIDELSREKELLNKKMLKTEADTKKQQNIVKLHEQSKKNLEHEIQNYKEEAQKQRKLIYQLEKERDRYINEASEMTQKCLG